jgi:hypothetical protein
MLNMLCILALLAVGVLLGSLVGRDPIRDSHLTWLVAPPGR